MIRAKCIGVVEEVRAGIGARGQKLHLWTMTIGEGDRLAERLPPTRVLCALHGPRAEQVARIHAGATVCINGRARVAANSEGAALLVRVDSLEWSRGASTETVGGEHV